MVDLVSRRNIFVFEATKRSSGSKMKKGRTAQRRIWKGNGKLWVDLIFFNVMISLITQTLSLWSYQHDHCDQLHFAAIITLCCSKHQRYFIFIVGHIANIKSRFHQYYSYSPSQLFCSLPHIVSHHQHINFARQQTLQYNFLKIFPRVRTNSWTFIISTFEQVGKGSWNTSHMCIDSSTAKDWRQMRKQKAPDAALVPAKLLLGV